MALTENDLQALRLLIQEGINDAFEQRFEPFRHETNRHFESLYAQNEKREQEYLFIKEQLSRHDKQFEKIDTRFEKIDTRFDNIEERLDRIEQKVDRHDQYFDDLDARVAELESKST